MRKKMKKNDIKKRKNINDTNLDQKSLLLEGDMINRQEKNIKKEVQASHFLSVNSTEINSF